MKATDRLPFRSARYVWIVCKWPNLVSFLRSCRMQPIVVKFESNSPRVQLRSTIVNIYIPHTRRICFLFYRNDTRSSNAGACLFAPSIVKKLGGIEVPVGAQR